MNEADLIASIVHRETGPFLVEENSNGTGYNIISCNNRFFAIHQSDGAFDLERIKRKNYKLPAYEAVTLGEMYELLTGKPLTPELRIQHLLERSNAMEALIEKFFRFVPPGHYYSPINSDEDVRAHAGYDRNAVTSIPGVDFDLKLHTSHLQAMIGEYESLPPFVKSKTNDVRYYYDNTEQWYFDAMAMRHFVRTCRPKRIIEVGGGFSTSVLMDAVDSFDLKTAFTIVEPDPVRVLALLKPTDLTKHKLIKDKVQNVPVELFDQLEAGDILFIDSSHVSKFRSDVNHYFFEILPRIKPGVFIHIHDIGYPFEYSTWMLQQGRSWSEAYMLRTFLMFNSSFRIEFWTAYASHFQGALIAEKMPLCRQWPGGAFWMQRL